MTNLGSILKSRDITLLTKVHLVKAMIFPVVMYGCELDCEESWVLKNWCFWIQLSHPYMTTGKIIALTRCTFVGKVMSLLFNKLSRLVIAFLPRSKHLCMAAVTICSDFGAQGNKVSHRFHCFPIYFPWSDGIFVFRLLSFKSF